MHSAVLRGCDFEISVGGVRQDHAEFFQKWTSARRLGFVSKHAGDGIGAANLIMAYVTAFYDTYRAIDKQFFAYPDFFSFQQSGPMASYAMLDIHPENKHVRIDHDRKKTLDAINDRAVNVLVVPQGPGETSEFNDIQLASSARNIDTCYVYAIDGQIEGADLTIGCPKEPLYEEYGNWIQSVLDSTQTSESGSTGDIDHEWFSSNKGKSQIEQTFKRISLEEALLLL